MSPGGHPVKGPPDWQAAFMPSVHQGTFIDTTSIEVEKLIDNIRNQQLSPEASASSLIWFSALIGITSGNVRWTTILKLVFSHSSRPIECRRRQPKHSIWVVNRNTSIACTARRLSAGSCYWLAVWPSGACDLSNCGTVSGNRGTTMTKSKEPSQAGGGMFTRHRRFDRGSQTARHAG